MIRVVSAYIRKNGLILLQQRSPHREFPHQWETPGGKVEPNEDDAEALNRELTEELEWHGSVKDAVWKTTFQPPEVPRSFEFVLYESVPDPKWVPHLKDAVGVGWFELNEVRQLNLTPGTRRFFEQLVESNWWEGDSYDW